MGSPVRSPYAPSLGDGLPGVFGIASEAIYDAILGPRRLGVGVLGGLGFRV